MNAIKQKRDENKEDTLIGNGKVSSRRFVCKCGCEVRLFGNIYSNMDKCHKCLIDWFLD